MPDMKQDFQKMRTNRAESFFADRSTRGNVYELRDETMQAFQKQSDELIGDRRYSLGFIKRKDSPEMAAVKAALQDITNMLQTDMSLQWQVFEQQIKQMEALYGRLEQACRVYVKERKGARTDAGQRRFAMVHQLLAQVEREKPLLATCAQEVYGGAYERKWSAVLWQMRTAQIDTAVYDEARSDGAGDDEVLHIRQKYDQVAFRREKKRADVDPQAMNKDTQVLQGYLAEYAQDKALQQAIWMLPAGKVLQSLQDLSDALYENGLEQSYQQLDRDTIRSLCSKLGLDDAVSDPAVFAMVSRVAVDVSHRINRERICDYAGMPKDANLSMRQVATSRMAKLLKMDGLVQEARMAQVTHDGKTVTGTITREPKGQSLLSLIEQARQRKIPVEYSPRSLQMMNMMHLFDAVCGQVNRDMSSIYVYCTDTGKSIRIESLTAVQNEICFGRLTYDQIRDGKIGRLPSLLNFDNPAQYALPMVDDTAFHWITTLDLRVLPYVLGDLLSKEEVDALRNRMEGIRDLLIDNVQKGKVELVRGTGEWAQQIEKFAQVEDGGAGYIDGGWIRLQAQRASAQRQQAQRQQRVVKAAAASATTTTTTTTTTTATTTTTTASKAADDEAEQEERAATTTTTTASTTTGV